MRDRGTRLTRLEESQRHQAEIDREIVEHAEAILSGYESVHGAVEPVSRAEFADFDITDLPAMPDELLVRHCKRIMVDEGQRYQRTRPAVDEKTNPGVIPE